MVYKYTVQPDKNLTAKGVGRDLAISTKQAIEICSKIRGLKVESAKRYLEEVIGMKRAVPMGRFNRDTGHKPGGIGPGRYPVKACGEILKIIKSVEINAQYKGLGQNLVIQTMVAHKGTDQWHYGRHRRRQMKKTHIEVVMKEMGEAKKETKKGAKVEKHAEVKSDKKPEAKAPVVKTVEKIEQKAKPEEKVAVLPPKKEEPKAEKPAVKIAELPKKDEHVQKVAENKVEKPAAPTQDTKEDTK